MDVSLKNGSATKTPAVDGAVVRRDFPIFERPVYGKALVFLDSAASAQKPRPVIDAVREIYEEYYANVHRGVYYLSQRSTDAFEKARAKVAAFIGANEAREIVFVRGATEAINLVAQSWGRANLKEGDEILLTHMEHHANIVPWQLLRDQLGLVIKVAPITDAGELDMAALKGLVTERTKLVGVTHASNALGTIPPVKDVIRLAHAAGAKVLVDGCQAVPHMPVDVKDLDADFYVFSGHKLYGPTGIGALYAKAEILEGMPPYQGGGEMIHSVTFEKTEFAGIPTRFEAGTPNIAGAVGLGAAVDYMTALGMEAVAAHDQALLAYATEKALAVEGLTIYGTAAEKMSILSFTLGGTHPHDVGTILDHQGVAVRAGHHCAQPLMDRFGVAATARASFGIYNTQEDVDALIAALDEVRNIFAGPAGQ